jgi:hypothetical protein
MRSLITGIFFVIGGLSGSFVLRGTGGSGALVLVGIVLLVLGFARLSGGGDQGMAPSEVTLALQTASRLNAEHNAAAT